MRYSGSKSKIAKDIIPFIMAELKEGYKYVEPFVGGCNMIDKINWGNKIGYDINHYVIGLWNLTKMGLSSNIPKEVSETDYNIMKKLAKNNKCTAKYPSWLIGYVGNACSYGSAWFNGYAKINEKRGENHILEAYNGYQKQVSNFLHLNDTCFMCADYKTAIALETSFGKNKNVVFYCDPPYRSTKGYKDDGLGFDNDEFWNIIREYSKLGIKIFVSEYEAPDDFKCVWEKNRKDGMGTTKFGKKQKIKTEKLFIYNG